MKLPSPLLTRAALERVIERHPYPRSGEIQPSPKADALEQNIWTRLLGAGEGLRDELVALTSKELAFLVYGARARLGDDKALRILRELFATRQVPRGDFIGLCCLILTNGDQVFRTAALSYASAMPTAETWRRVVQSSTPLDVLATAYVSSGLPFAAWIERTEPRLDRVPAVARRIRVHLLDLKWLSQTMHREGSTVVDGWLNKDLLDADRQIWYRRYLVETDSRGWRTDDEILTSIVERYGKPQERRPFWDAVPNDARKAVERWLLECDLRNLIREGERVAFWKHYLDEIAEIRETRGREAVLISFPTWFALKYRESGRATYLFNRTHLFKCRQLEESALYRYVLANAHFSLDRFEHRGQNWQWHARRIVDGVLAEQKKASL